jgi:transcription initiation factor IIE alpha subunit
MTFECPKCKEMLDGLTCTKCGKTYRDPFRGLRRMLKIRSKN